MTTLINNAVQRLNEQLPLKARQQALPPGLASVHRATLTSLAEQGQPPNREELGELLDSGDIDAAIARLANDDLVVLNAAGTEIVGAYPMTTEDTPHHLRINKQPVNAMCALDALSVGPMFDAATCRMPLYSAPASSRRCYRPEDHPAASCRHSSRRRSCTRSSAHCGKVGLYFLHTCMISLSERDAGTFPLLTRAGTCPCDCLPRITPAFTGIATGSTTEIIQNSLAPCVEFEK
jgi:hypothetical protein